MANLIEMTKRAEDTETSLIELVRRLTPREQEEAKQMINIILGEQK